MMKEIWKETLPIGPAMAHATLPAGSKPIAVQLQHGRPTMWFMVDKSQPTVPFTILSVGTGMPFDPTGLNYLSTVQDLSGFVWHYFWAAP